MLEFTISNVPILVINDPLQIQLQVENDVELSEKSNLNEKLWRAIRTQESYKCQIIK